LIIVTIAVNEVFESDKSWRYFFELHDGKETDLNDCQCLNNDQFAKRHEKTNKCHKEGQKADCLWYRADNGLEIVNALIVAIKKNSSFIGEKRDEILDFFGKVLQRSQVCGAQINAELNCRLFDVLFAVVQDQLDLIGFLVPFKLYGEGFRRDCGCWVCQRVENLNWTDQIVNALSSPLLESWRLQVNKQVNGVGSGMFLKPAELKWNVLGEFAERCTWSKFINWITGKIRLDITERIASIIVQIVSVVTSLKLIDPNGITTNKIWRDFTFQRQVVQLVTRWA
jgi:hypothetical protein